MARSSASAWLVSGALVLAACGSGDDANPDEGTAPSDRATSTEGDSQTPGSLAEGEPEDPAPSSGDEPTTGNDAADPGPALEPALSFGAPASGQPVADRIAVSPTGDRVALMWIAESDFATNLTVFDATTGAELASIADDRLDGDLFWTSDDRLISVGGFGELWVWDSTTLAAASDAPLTGTDTGCSSGNGIVFDPVAGALFMKSDGLCRIDVTTGAVVEYTSATPTTLLAVAVGGNEIYLRGTDDAGELVLRVLDATTLAVASDEPAAGPNPVIAASGNGLVEQEPGGFGYLVQPGGRVVDFNTAGITTSAGGSYYVSGFDGGAIVVSSADGSTIGTITNSGGALPRTAWSLDDTVLAARTDAGVSVYAIG